MVGDFIEAVRAALSVAHRFRDPAGNVLATFALIAFTFWLEPRFELGSRYWLIFGITSLVLAGAAKWPDVNPYWRTFRWRVIPEALNAARARSLPESLFKAALPNTLEFKEPISFLLPAKKKLTKQDQILFGYVRPGLLENSERFCQSLFMPPGEWCVMVLWRLRRTRLNGYRIYLHQDDQPDATLEEYNPYRQPGTKRNWYGIIHNPPPENPPCEARGQLDIPMGFMLLVPRVCELMLVINWNETPYSSAESEERVVRLPIRVI